MRKAILLLATIVFLAVPSSAEASHSFDVTTARTAYLLSSTQVHVSGTLTCVDAAESGSVGVVLIQPSGGVALNGGGSTPFNCQAGETVSWTVVVAANESSTFARGEARFDTFANTDCSETRWMSERRGERLRRSAGTHLLRADRNDSRERWR